MTWEESFLKEIEELAERHNNIPLHKAFLIWYLTATENLSTDRALDLITDRSHDAWIDAIYFDNSSKKVKVYQSKYSANFGKKAFDKDNVVTFCKIYDFLEGKLPIEQLREYANPKIKQLIDQAMIHIKDDGYLPQLYFITTHLHNENAKIINGGTLIEIVAHNELKFKFTEWQHGHTPELGVVDLPYTSALIGPVNPKGYIVNINTGDLRKVYQKHNKKLFSRNIRIFYGNVAKKPSPNSALLKTLADTPQNFWYFNNGITILAQEVLLNDQTKIMRLKNPQIINGCQTVSTIGETVESGAQLFAKVVEIKDDGENQPMIDRIIEANNRQNPVSERMLKSNHPLQVTLSRKLENQGYFYERKEKEHSQLSKESTRIKSLKRINNVELVKANLALVQPPHLTIESSTNELFSTRFDDVFNPRKSHLEYLIPYLITKEIYYIGSDHRSSSKERFSFHKLAQFHILRFIYDACPELKSFSKLRTIYDLLSKNTLELPASDIKELFDALYNLYKQSDYNGINSGQRDFLKGKNTYDSFISKIPTGKKNSIQKEIIAQLN